jgi:hypothetical protein
MEWADPPVWQQNIYGNGASNSINGIVQTSDGAFVFVGDQVSTQESKSQIWVVKLDDSGNVIWEQTIGDNDHEMSGYAIVASPSGGTVVAGTSLKNGSGNNPVGVVFELDARGTMVWQAEYLGQTYAIASTRDGGYALCGFVREGLNSPVYALRLRSDGTKIWETVYNGFQCFVAQQASIVEDASQRLVMVVSDLAAGVGAGYVIQTDENGNVIWARATNNLRPCSVGVLSDGAYAIGGTLLDFYQELHAYVAVLSNDGHKILWDNTESATMSSIGSVIVIDNKDVVAAGTWPNDTGDAEDGGLFVAGLTKPSI